jgi:transcriptional regulator with XRE-family HTH domain
VRTATRLGKRIKTLRQERSLSQEALAEKALLDAKHLAVMERGATNPTLASIAWVARGLGVSLAQLFEGV